MKKNIVNLRFISIILVVLGHSIILYSNDWSIYETTNKIAFLDYSKYILNLFSMPLFFSISGYLFSMHHENNIIKFVTKKLKRLIIPYICVTVFWLVPIRLCINYPGYINKNVLNIIFSSIIFGNDNGHLWYLPTLFCCFIIIIFLQKKFYNKNNIFFWGSIASSLFYIFPISLCSIQYINTTLQYFCWFCIGGIIYIYENKLNKLSIALISISNLFFVLLVIFFRYENFIFLNILKLICGILCICLIYRLSPNTKINKLVNKIASNSFGIYLFHSPLVYITYSKINNANPIIIIFINFFIFGTLSYFLTNIIRFVKLNFIIGE